MIDYALRLVVLLIFGSIVIGYSIVFIGYDQIAGQIGIGIGAVIIILGLIPKKEK